MNLTVRWTVLLVMLAITSHVRAQDVKVPLSSLDLSKMTAGWGKPEVDRNCVGKTMRIAERSFDHGVGTHANSLMHIRLDGKTQRFTAKVGVDDETKGKGTISFRVYGDGEKLFDSGLMKGGEQAKEVDVPLEGVSHLMLTVGSGSDDINFDHANWAEAEFFYRGAKPMAVSAPIMDEEKVILTPKPGPMPRINGPPAVRSQTGTTVHLPDSVYRRSADDVWRKGSARLVLPSMNRSGIITGHVPDQPGQYVVTLTARNDAGSAKREFTIVVGDTLALTPPMGWNSWYIHYHRVTGKVMREAADVMVASGMADYGYMYVNIDDCWMRIEPEYFEQVKNRLAGFDMTRVIGELRDEQGNILTNGNFPDMKAMTDYIHAKGLRAGIYTSPGPRTCQRYAGSYQHERQDAEQFAKWGFDFLKYDWCSYTQVYNERMKESEDDLAEKKHPYQEMGDILKTLDRDIVLNLCQYGMNDVWKWGGEVGGHCWRTTGDLGLHRGSRLPGFFHIGMSNAQALAVCQAGPMERSGLHSHRLGGFGPRTWDRQRDDVDRKRAVQLHVDVVADGRAVVLQRGYGQTG